VPEAIPFPQPTLRLERRRILNDTTRLSEGHEIEQFSMVYVDAEELIKLA
jgi:hypothetical protein